MTRVFCNTEDPLQKGYLIHLKNDLSQTAKLEEMLILINVTWYIGLLLVFLAVLLLMMTIII